MREIIEYRLAGPSTEKALRDLYGLITHLREKMIEENWDGDFNKCLSIPRRVESLERNLIEAALHKTGGNITKAACLLDVSRNGLHKKMKALGIRAKQ